MDIICPKCTEPYDLSELHDNDFGLSFSDANRKFHTDGCSAVFETRCTPVESLRGDVSAAMYDMLGDDIDGIAAMMEDFDMMDMFD